MIKEINTKINQINNSMTGLATSLFIFKLLHVGIVGTGVLNACYMKPTQS